MASKMDFENLEALSHAAMIELQQRLGLPSTGIFDEIPTVKALRAFQADHQLSPTGELHPDTLRALETVCICENLELHSILPQDDKDAALLCNRQALNDDDLAKLLAYFEISKTTDPELELVRSIVRYEIHHGIEPSGVLSDALRKSAGILHQENNPPLELQNEEKSSPKELSGNTKISPHFTWSEFSSTGDHLPVPELYQDNVRFLCEQLEILRKALGNRRIQIISGWRSSWWNKRIGASDNSEHLLGMAADFTVDGIKPSQVRRVLENLIERGEIYDGGVGRYTNFTHYDIGEEARRWNG